MNKLFDEWLITAYGKHESWDDGWSQMHMAEAFKAGMLAAAEIAKPDPDWNRTSRAYEFHRKIEYRIRQAAEE